MSNFRGAFHFGEAKDGAYLSLRQSLKGTILYFLGGVPVFLA